MQGLGTEQDASPAEAVTARVLLVDDQAIIGEAVRRTLATESGLAFHFCSDAAKALALAIQLQPTVILQDLVMPHTDGLSLVKEYRANTATCDIPIIVLSTKEEPRIKSAAFAAGADDYLVKLPDSLELVARIRYHSRSYQALRQRDEAAQALQRSQQQLLETHQELRLLLDTVPTAILKLDRHGHILQGNRAAQNLLMTSGEELNGSAFIEMLASEARATFSKRLLAVATATGVNTSYTEAELWRHNASMVPIEYLITPLPTAEGRELTLVMSDITERKAADRAKSEFISTVSHELRTPLTSIRGSLGLILSGKLGELPERAARMVDIASRNSERLTQLINDILDMEKISAGSMSFNIVAVGADTAMDAAVAVNEGYALRHDVLLRVGARTEGARIKADELRLQQVFSNLISNAIKYSPAGGYVDLSAERVQDYVRFRVRDHGTGIPEHFRERIFQRFSQADSSDARARGGTGLGLSIAQNIVEQLGGEIGFDTAETGTEFFFCLPSADLTIGEPAAGHN
jgi:PAS domain S-box-containing protein